MWVGLLAMLFGAGVVIVVGWYAWQEKLPRQGWAGIRTPYSMANDEQWRLVHRYGAPYLIFGGVAVFAASMALFPFAVAGALPDAFSAAVLLASALILGASAVMSWVFGVRGAKAQLGQ